MKIKTPELKVIRFGSDDVIATSGLVGPLTGTSASFYIPAGQYSGGSYSGEYVEFNGVFGAYNGSTYEIINISGAHGEIDDERADHVDGGAGAWGYPPASVMGNIAKQYYDAYSSGGAYYTNGQSYYDLYYQ